MNLAALWAHERARVAAAEPPGEPASAHDDRRSLHRVPSNSALPKKKSSVVARRELLHERLGDLGAFKPRVQSNEFAIEYADRAPKRLASPPHAGASAAAEGASGVANEPPKPVKRKASGLAAVAAPPAVPVSLSSRPAVSKVAASLVATTTGALPRRNARKRGGAGANSLDHASHAFKPYVGDMFSTRGDYVEGMLYMSRMKRSHQLTFGHDAGEFSLAGRATLKDAVTDAFSAAVAAAAAGNLNVTAGDGVGVVPVKGAGVTASATGTDAGGSAALLSEISPEEILQLRQRQRCSLTLSNWSSNPENARQMVEENVVQALILLCKASEGDRVTRLHCVTTFMNLSHVDDLRSEMVQQGAAKTLVEIASEAEDDKTLRTACAVTLCNLCCCVEGEEEILVEDGAVGALSLLINEHPKTASICLGALFNLTCVREPYHKIESVLKAFLTLASSSSSPTAPGGAGRDEIIAKAICNLSNFKRVRLRLMEEGVVSALSNLIHPSHSQIHQLLAYVLLNLSAMRACRSELVAKGCIGALITLTGAASSNNNNNNHNEAKCLVALTLWNLSKEPGNRLRMVFEGLLLLVNELCRGSPADPNGETIRAVCARTVYNVSCTEDVRVKLVERDAVSILSTLSQRCVGDDGKKMCTLALCNLLSVQQAAADIVTAGAITSLIELSMVSDPPQTLETRHLFSKALYGLCEMTATRASVVHAGIVPAILHLSSISVSTPHSGGVGARQASLLSEIRARCTAALACLAGDEALATHVCSAVVVRCVVQTLILERFNVAIERFCCSCLSLLCRDETCSLVVANEGAIQAVLSTCLESTDLETKASCCHVLASMSCHRSCCMALVDTGTLPVLATLAKTGGSKGSASTVQRCCAITLANLSAEKDIRTILAKSSIVPLLSLLSNSYSEDSQRDCARVLCNLSSVDGQEQSLVRDGALGVLMMISMVRALQPATKETCVRAFANLLTASTARAMVQEGIVKVLPAFAGMATASTGDSAFASSVVQVVSVIFGKLVRYEDGRRALSTERAALRALVALRPQQEEQSDLYEHLLCEIILHDELRERSVDAGVVEALQQLSAQYLSAGRSVARVALMLFTLAKNEKTRQAAASPSSLSALSALLVHDKRSLLYTVSTLCHLAWDEVTKSQIGSMEVTAPLTQLLRLAVEENGHVLSQDAVSTCLVTLCCLSDSDEHLSVMVQENVLDHLYGLMERLASPSLVCILSRQLSHSPAFLASLVRSSLQSAVAIKLFCALAKGAAAQGDHQAMLDSADMLCSITFLPPTSQNPSSTSRPTLFVRRQSQPQLLLRGSVAIASSIPPAALVSADVLDAIAALLLTESQLEETRWRCLAALFAFSCIADYRHTLVRMGCTRLLVNEATTATESASPVELASLRSCAGALCNLTIVPGANANANARTMVEEGAVPALIHLAKRDNDEIREYCTLALSNLSSQSPKVESGAVSALLSLSFQSNRLPAAHANSPVGVSRPPPVVDARHKEISTLPDFTLEVEPLEHLLHSKYEAVQCQASKPPPPLLPTISSNFPTVGGLSRTLSSGEGPDGSDAGVNREEVMLRRRKSSSIGDIMGLSPVATPASGNNTSRSNEGFAGVEGDLRGWQTLSFPKIDPVESRALSLSMGDDDEDPPDSRDSTRPPSANDSREEALDAVAKGANEEEDDSRSESEDSYVGKSKHKSPNTLSPLARVVVRKAQTSHAVEKLKKLRSGNMHSGSRNGMTSSTSMLPLATVEEAVEPGPQPHTASNRRLAPAQTFMSRASSLQKLSVPARQNSSNPAVEDTTPTIHDEPNAASVSDTGTGSLSLAHAAATAKLYSAGPATPLSADASGHAKRTAKAKASRSNGKTKRPERAAARVSPLVTSIEDVQAQVKLLGLWS